MRILGIAGSLRADSHNRALLRLAGSLLPAGAELVEWGGLRELPPFDEDAEGALPKAVAAFLQLVREADAVVIATPEYNGSVPGALKNALDWGSRPVAAHPFRGKPVTVMGASTGAFGAVWAQADLRRILGLMGARVVSAELPVGQASTRLAEPEAELLEQLGDAMALLVAEASPQSVAA